MKIKLAILEKDKSYLSRIVSSFGTKYSDKLEVYSFTEYEVALQTIAEVKIDVFISSDSFEIDTTKLPSRCSFAYFVDSADIDMLNDQPTICKFQKADLIYKQILSIYSEHAGSISGFKNSDDDCKVIAFGSPSGGVGSSTMAAACALHFAMQGKKTLYLNFEKYGSSDLFFSAEGQFDMSDIIFALKSRKANLSLKLESCIKQDKRGVYFYSQPKLALDMMELGTEEILRLVSEIRLTDSYEYVILDLDFGIDKKQLDIYRQAHELVLVCDGSEMSNLKVHRAYTALSTLEKNSDSPLTNRMGLIYNKFSNKTSKTLGDIGLKDIGGSPRFEHASIEQVLTQLSAMNMFDKIN